MFSNWRSKRATQDRSRTLTILVTSAAGENKLMTPWRLLSRRVPLTAVTLAAVAAFWAVVAWISRDVRPSAIRWTTTFVIGGLVATCAVGCLIAVTWAKNRRLMIFRVATLTLVLAPLWLFLEAAAWFRVMDYRIMSTLLFDQWSGPTELFVDDVQLFYRRPANISWSGRPRSDMAREWNLPIRAPRYQTFTTDSKGFRNSRDLSHADIVLLGDSYIEGLYVSDDETAAMALGRLVGRPVANLGTAGYGTLQELLVLQQYAFALRPQLVAWFFSKATICTTTMASKRPRVRIELQSGGPGVTVAG